MDKIENTDDFLCHEVFKNVYFVGVRNVEGENHPWHTVWCDSPIRVDVKSLHIHVKEMFLWAISRWVVCSLGESQ